MGQPQAASAHFRDARALLMPETDQIRLGRFSLLLVRDFMNDASQLQQRLLNDLPWSQDVIRLFGRQVPIPRQQCWIGDPRARYRYSGLDLAPLPWPEWLLPARDRVNECCQWDCNSVLCNRYRHGWDSMGWHSDDEPELGPAPLIAALTFGGGRRFQFRHRRDRHLRTTLVLPHNSLLVMPEGLQGEFQHQLPKTRQPVAERISLTFRRILVPRST